MQSKQEDKMSREEIIYYVDNLIETNKKSYDKRLAPLLYEFFLRANEKFEWDRQEFLEKYKNFENNVKKIKFKKFKGNTNGVFNISNQEITIDKRRLKKIKEEDYINLMITDLFHECLHATDLKIRNRILVSEGFYEIVNNNRYKKDTMLDEYANVLATVLIASDEPMYYDRKAIYARNNGGYEKTSLIGSIMCAAFDMPEIELAKLKDKGRKSFDLYLKNKFPYMNTEVMLNIFKGGLNIVYNANKKGDKENVKFGLENIIDTAFDVIEYRISGTLANNENIKESVERIYYSIYKIQKILEKVDSKYEIEDDKEIYNFERFETIEKLLNQVKLYKRFVNNKDLFTIVEQAQIHRGIVEHDENIVKELIESKIGQEYSEDEFDIEEIAKKYYLPSNDPLNDNKALIEQVKKIFKRPTIKERLKKIIGIEQEEFPMLPSVSGVLKTVEQSNMRSDIRYEIPIIHEINTEEKKQDISRGDEESTRE